MPTLFVHRPFYRLQELCSRWNLSACDLASFALAGEITISVPVTNLPVEEGECNDLTFDSSNRPMGPWKTNGKKTVTGTVDLLAQDAWTAIRHERVCARYFQNGRGSYLRVDLWWDKGPEITVEHEDLVVLREETERFETACGLGTGKHNSSSKEGALRGAPTRHDWDAIWSEAVYTVHTEGVPPTLTGLVERILDSLEKQGHVAPDESTLKKKLRSVFNRLKGEAE